MEDNNTKTNVNFKLFAALLLMGLIPTLYTTFRTYLIGQLPGDWSYSIAGQLSWVNLLYEILDEAIILPLFFILGSPKKNPNDFSNRIKTGVLLSSVIYFFFAVIINIFINPMLKLMATDATIIQESAQYIRIESFANVFGIIFRFLCVAIIAVEKERFVYIITGIKLLLCIFFDTLLVSSLPFSLNLSVTGIGISNIVVNIILGISAFALLLKNGYIKTNKSLTFSWVKGFAKIGSISGLESFVRNIAYMLMVSRMVNLVGEQGTYWVANNFIWGWMLLPVLQLGELIKQETAEDANNIKKNTPTYFKVTGVIILIWVITIPFYKPFMANVLGFEDVDKLFKLVMILLIPYITFALQNVFDATFYGRGRTDYMLFESVVTNSIYYGIAFIAYLLGFWTPTLYGIALLFGAGNIFDAVISGIAYWHFRKHFAKS